MTTSSPVSTASTAESAHAAPVSRFHHALTVRRAEVDAQGIVFNAHYLMYADTAVMAYWRALGVPYASAMRRLGTELPVRKAAVEYFASARPDDRLRIGVRLVRVGRTSVTLEAVMRREHTVLARAEVVYVCVDAADRVPTPVPVVLRSLLERFESDGAACRLETGDWARLQADAQPLRREVFVVEQGVPEHEEWDEADATAVHAVVYNGLGQGIATGRLLQHAPGVGRIGRMAVDHGVRGGGHGAQVLDGLIAAARACGDREVVLNAQQSAIGFYRGRGFAPYGEAFEEVGIPHQAMRLVL